MLRISVFCLCAIVFTFSTGAAWAGQGEAIVVFEDRFDRESEGDGSAAVGNDWKLNTKENHQFVVKSGALHVTRNGDAKHSANLLHKAEFRNGTLAMRFQLVNADDEFNVQIRDSAFTKVKQGMLINVRLVDGALQLQDAAVANVIRQEVKSAKTATPSAEQQKELDRVTESVPASLSVGEWYVLLITVHENKLTASINVREGMPQPTVELITATIGHATKDNFRVEVQQALVIDSVRVSKTNTAQES